MRILLFLGSLTSLVTGGVAAQSGIAIERSVYIEREEILGGREVRALEPAAKLRKNDQVVLMLRWFAPGNDDGFVVSSRLPHELAFRRSGGRRAEVSVDGGRSWGLLDTLRIGARRATPEDVTHLRWRVSGTEAAVGTGTLSYSAIVR